MLMRPRFDPRHEFVVVPPAGQPVLRVGALELRAGDKFNKALVDARRLRQMYEARLLRIADAPTTAPKNIIRRRRLNDGQPA